MEKKLSFLCGKERVLIFIYYTSKKSNILLTRC
jgi:hypothetical protein